MADIEVATLTDDQLAEELRAATHRMLVTRLASSVFTGMWAIVYTLSAGRLGRYPSFLPIALAVFLTGPRSSGCACAR